MSTLKTATRTPAIPRHRVVGLAVVLLAVLVVVLLAWRPDPFGSTRRAQAVFRDTGTLGPLEVEVRVAGTPVGRVVGQRRLGDDAQLDMEIDYEPRPGVRTVRLAIGLFTEDQRLLTWAGTTPHRIRIARSNSPSAHPAPPAFFHVIWDRRATSRIRSRRPSGDEVVALVRPALTTAPRLDTRGRVLPESRRATRSR